MPIYEYACEKCDSEFEVEQRITDDPLKTCPRCRSRKIKRLISNTSFVLKGGGWYADLYSSSDKSGKSGKSGGEAGEGSTSESSSSSKSGEGSGDSGKAAKDTGKSGKGKGKGAKAAA